MIFEKIISKGLAHNSYFVGSAGEAAIIDPRRDCDIYLERTHIHNVKITHIFETHRNEDYCIGSRELSHATGAEIFHGSHLNFGYGNSVKEGDIFRIGNMELKILETPGHTDESISLTVKDLEMADEVYMVFTGDTLFAGDVGRTDLYGADKVQLMTENLYSSLRKVLSLGDSVIVCPAHGAGSVCGAQLSEHEFTTIGYEKKTNSHLLKTKDAFTEYKIREYLYRPPYFRKMEVYNRDGPPLLGHLPYVKPLNVKEVRKTPAQLVDVRHPPAFAGGHIPGSYSIWKEGVPLFAGWFLNYEDPLIIIEEDTTQLTEIVRYFVRLGYDNIGGYLAGGFSAWYKNAQPVEKINLWSVQELRENLKNDIYLLDVREIHNWEKDGYIQGAHHLYVGELRDRLHEVPHKSHIVVYCDSGFKTSIATSILKMHEYQEVTGVLGGMMAWKIEGYPVVKGTSQ
ncbi:MAG: MBL fold metallo-hydrolase [Theionarchaea archaeon]|nr:MBL fold metallo-hydrolase [Theionarchaea archaeon]